MPPIPNRLLVYGIAGLLLVALIGGLWLRGSHWRDRFETLRAEAAAVVIAVRNASDNPKVTWKTAPAQITQMGVDRRSLLQQVEDVNAKLLEASQDAARRKAAAEEAQRLMRRAIAQRESAMRRLQQEALTPGTREDCDQLIREADEVQRILRETAKEAGV